MADFKTHLAGAAIGSAALATSLASSDTIESGEALGLFTVGVVGGLLPDVDLGHSTPVSLARKAATAFGIVVIAFQLADVYSIVEIAIVALGMYFVVQSGFKLFDKFTKHRGLFHSLPAAMVCGLTLGVIIDYLTTSSDALVWFYIAFMFLGFILHLVLDEAYSVNLLGASFKRSFGTALKLGDKKNPLGTALLYLGVVLLFTLNPPVDSALDILGDSSTYSSILNNLWPQGQWFQSL